MLTRSVVSRIISLATIFSPWLSPAEAITTMIARASTRQLEPDGSRVWQPRGQSRIIDSDGSVLGQLAEEEGVLTADAVIGPGPQAQRGPAQLRWLAAARALGRPPIMIPLDIAGGRLAHTVNRQRRRKARAAAEETNDPATVAV